MRAQMTKKDKEIMLFKKTTKDQELKNHLLSQSGSALIDSGVVKKKDKEIRKLKAQNEKLEEKVSEISTKNDELSAETNLLKSQKREVERESADHWHTILKLKMKRKEEVDELKNTIHKQTEELGEKFGTDVFQARKNKTTTDLANMTRKCEQLFEENAKLRRKNGALMEENDKTKAENKNIRNDYIQAFGCPPRTIIADLAPQSFGDDDQNDDDQNLDAFMPREVGDLEMQDSDGSAADDE